jgi:hypothetical protein
VDERIAAEDTVDVRKHDGVGAIAFKDARIGYVTLGSQLTIGVTNLDDAKRNDLMITVSAGVVVQWEGAPDTAFDVTETSNDLGELVVALRFRRVERLEITTSGALRLVLGDTLNLTVPSSAECEAWVVELDGRRWADAPSR